MQADPDVAIHDEDGQANSLIAALEENARRFVGRRLYSFVDAI